MNLTFNVSRTFCLFYQSRVGKDRRKNSRVIEGQIHEHAYIFDVDNGAKIRSRLFISVLGKIVTKSYFKIDLDYSPDLTILFLARKKVEHAWKAFLYDGQTVSVTRPDRYADRFERFMFGKVFVSLPMTESLRRLNAQTGRSRPKLKLEKVIFGHFFSKW